MCCVLWLILMMWCCVVCIVDDVYLVCDVCVMCVCVVWFDVFFGWCVGVDVYVWCGYCDCCEWVMVCVDAARRAARRVSDDGGWWWWLSGRMEWCVIGMFEMCCGCCFMDVVWWLNVRVCWWFDRRATRRRSRDLKSAVADSGCVWVFWMNCWWWIWWCSCNVLWVCWWWWCLDGSVWGICVFCRRVNWRRFRVWSLRRKFRDIICVWLFWVFWVLVLVLVLI